MYDPKVNSAGRIYKIGERFRDTESRNMFADIRGKTLLIFDWVGNFGGLGKYKLVATQET
jgi:hypothetical protein